LFTVEAALEVKKQPRNWTNWIQNIYELEGGFLNGMKVFLKIE
jgi:hypothetical protein